MRKTVKNDANPQGNRGCFEDDDSFGLSANALFFDLFESSQKFSTSRRTKVYQKQAIGNLLLFLRWPNQNEQLSAFERGEVADANVFSKLQWYHAYVEWRRWIAGEQVTQPYRDQERLALEHGSALAGDEAAAVTAMPSTFSQSAPFRSSPKKRPSFGAALRASASR
jgi:hypothetical protein